MKTKLKRFVTPLAVLVTTMATTVCVTPTCNAATAYFAETENREQIDGDKTCEYPRERYEARVKQQAEKKHGEYLPPPKFDGSIPKPPTDENGNFLPPPPQKDENGKPAPPPPPLDGDGKPLPPPMDENGKPLPPVDKDERPLPPPDCGCGERLADE